MENAVKHGIGQRLDGGTITVVAERVGSQLRIRVENDADPADAAPRAGKGIGLVNVRQRLAAAYGRQGSVHWARKDHTFAVDLVLPAQTNEDQ